MEQLLLIREYLKAFVSKYENYVRPISKFLLALVALLMINGKVGFSSRLTNGAIVLIVALVASFLPIGFIPVVAALFIFLHLYSLSLEAFIVIGIVMALLFLLFFRFSPKGTVLLVLTPILFQMKIPYIMPLVAGLVSTPAAIVSVGSGAILYYMLTFVSENADAIRGMASSDELTKIKFILDELIYDKEMLMIVIAFAVTIIIVSIIRRLPVDHAWTIAIIAGTLTDIVVILFGDLKFGTYISIVGLLFGSLLGVLITFILQFFLFNLDYSRTEKVQFEDDDYYYFVKAVPKVKPMVRGKKSKSAHAKKQNSHAEYEEKNVSPANKKVRIDNDEDITNEDVEKYRSRREVIDEEMNYRRRSDGLSDIERAAAAKARAGRNKT